MQGASGEHKDFGQPVVSEGKVVSPLESDEQPLTPSQAAARFQIPEYLLRRACTEGRLAHLRVVNALWLSPKNVAPFARSWRDQNRKRQKD